MVHLLLTMGSLSRELHGYHAGFVKLRRVVEVGSDREGYTRPTRRLRSPTAFRSGRGAAPFGKKLM